eukprot:5908528-Pleurochrysis_carterae.AAC.1
MQSYVLCTQSSLYLRAFIFTPRSSHPGLHTRLFACLASSTVAHLSPYRSSAFPSLHPTAHRHCQLPSSFHLTTRRAPPKLLFLLVHRSKSSPQHLWSAKPCCEWPPPPPPKLTVIYST